MSWIDITWPMMGAASLTLGLIYLLVWFRQRGQPAHLVFSLAAGSVSALAIVELLAMRAQEPGHYIVLARWGHVVLTALVAALVGFVLLHFRAGRPWLGVTICALRTLSVAASFAADAGVNFQMISSLGKVEVWNAVISVPLGAVNPWMAVAQLSNLLLVGFMLDALVTVWRRGASEERHRALIVCGSMALFVALASLWAASVVLHWVAGPLTVCTAFLIVIMAMSYELASDVVRAPRLDRQLMTSQNDLLESEQRIQLAAHAAGLGFWTSDLETKEFWFSEMGTALVGVAPNERISRESLLAVVHPDDRESVLHAFDEAISRSGEYAWEYRVLHPAGRTRWIAVEGRVEYSGAGTPKMMRGVIVDITERRQAEERFRLVIEGAATAMLMTGVDGRITLANAQAECLFGYSRAELLDGRLEMLLPDCAEHSIDRTDSGISSRTRAPGMGSQLPGRRKDGSVVMVEVRFTPIQIADDRLVLASVTDMSELIRFRQEAALQRDELAHLSRVTLLGEMSGTIAHELNQPLTAVLSNAQAALRFLEHDPPDLGDVRNCLVDIVENDKRASEVIRRLRAMLRKEQADYQPLAPNEMVSDVLRLIAADILNRNVVVSLDLGADLPMVDGDRVQLQQVLLNLIINACDAMQDVDMDRSLTFRTRAVGGAGVKISIIDAGRGIEPNDLDRIFTPFVTSKSEGIGLGLAICRTIIRAHGGTIWATNNGTRGATFNVQLAASGETGTNEPA